MLERGQLGPVQDAIRSVRSGEALEVRRWVGLEVDRGASGQRRGEGQSRKKSLKRAAL
jgi:hypothetical protein